jgi:Putative zinc-finger/Gram-negative bacterial TonB protein C-terminal
MKCRTVRSRLSAYRDGDLTADETRLVSLHLGSCEACGAHWTSWSDALDALSGLPLLQCDESIAARIQTRLEVETRGPGLSLLFRPMWSARPLFLPSLVPAVGVLLAVVSGVFLLDWEADRLPAVYVRNAGQSWNGPMPMPASGTEGNPLFPSETKSLPRTRPGDGMLTQALESVGPSNLFVRTVVDRDGRVAEVSLIEGDSFQAAAILDVLRHQRFEPSLIKGRPVAVSFYRLISGTEVRAPMAAAEVRAPIT